MSKARSVALKRLAVLISNGGTGTNLQAIIDAVESKKLNAVIAVVISGKPDAYGLVRAKKYQIPTIVMKPDTDLYRILKIKYRVDYVCLAGWKRVIPDDVFSEFKDRILNVHPGLVPSKMDGVVKNPDGTDALWNKQKFGDAAVQSFFDEKATYAGASAHFLSEEFDFGKVLARGFEKIRKDDNVETLYERLKKKEHRIYIKALQKLCN